MNELPRSLFEPPPLCEPCVRQSLLRLSKQFMSQQSVSLVNYMSVQCVRFKGPDLHMAWRKARTLRWAPRPEDVSTSAGTDGPDSLIERMLLTAPPEGRDEDELLEVRSRASSDLGDSRHNSDWGGEDEAAGPHAAVAEQSPGAPRCREARRLHRPPRDTTPMADNAGAADKWTKRNDQNHVGNIGWLFGNWGKRPSNANMREHIDMVLKRNPAMIIGMAECCPQTEQVLRDQGADGDPHAARGSLESRHSYQYLTLRGNEESSVLIGIRNTQGNALTLLDWERREEGCYRRKTGHGKATAYSRSLIAKIDMDYNVGFLGTSHNVMVVHLHNLLANNKWPNKLAEFWGWLKCKIELWNVKVLMGDFNMSLFKVIPELRSRGVTVDLAAWYPWKSPMGLPMSDSCGIFFIDAPGEYTLHKGLDDLHDRTEHGILHKAEGRMAEELAAGDGFDRIDVNGGPGMALSQYLPKKMESHLKLKESLKPSQESEQVVRCEKDNQAVPKQRTILKVREKRLQADLWRREGQEQKGSHFPICAFTNNVGRRSKERMVERSRKAWVSRNAKWHQPQSRHHETPQSWHDAPSEHSAVYVWPPWGGSAWACSHTSNDERGTWRYEQLLWNPPQEQW